MKRLILVPLIFLFVCCGKKSSDSTVAPTTSVTPQTSTQLSDFEEVLSGQELKCESADGCPNYIAKIVTFENKVPRYCTGFLVSNRILATSASCLPQLLRLRDQDCRSDLGVFFPVSGILPAERVGCTKVLMASQLTGKDVSLWREDVAFLELAKEMPSRGLLIINRAGFENQKKYDLWSIKQVDDKLAFVRKQNCEVVQNSYINPLASKNTSPNMTFADCELLKEATGSPIIDVLGRVQGVASVEMDQGLRKYIEGTGLLTSALKSFFHATNFSCAPTVFDSTVEDERECSKEVDSTALERLREDMMISPSMYEEQRIKLEERVSSDSKYFNFKVHLVSQGDFKQAVVTPKCFKNVSGWINSLNTSRGNFIFTMGFPQTGFKPTLNAYAQIGSQQVDSGVQNMFVQFSARQLKASRTSNVYVWKAGTEATTYSGIKENCL
jgi:hypothetical protein